MEARRQAAISRAHPAGVAVARRGPAASGPRPDRVLARSLPAARHPMPARSAERGVTPAPRPAMLPAAALGTRLRPVTETILKPPVDINARALIAHAPDRPSLAG